MAKKLVSIIIVNWNARKFMQECAASLKNNTLYPNYEVIAIDNGSRDGSAELLKQLKEKGLVHRVILNKRNRGFAAANNQGFKIARGDYIFMLNNDVLLEKGWLEKAVELLESDKRIAAVGSTLIGFNDRAKDVAKAHPRERQTLCGAAMLMRKSALENVGLLDEENFSPAYGEETDWCYRARNSGFRLLETTDSVVKHYGSGSTLKQMPKKGQYLLMNEHRLKAMLYNLSILDFLRHVPGLGLILLQSFGQGMTLTLLQSYWNNLGKIPSILEKRGERRKKAALARKKLGLG
ncbi:MAG: glycosyltransferase family 2 protein [Candidatus Diapherotrites archaeon]|uniref:Glycosyltransferase family 2 protein n=1 Tax=Candidatus Iainarchaeum sp. TaxID=3101447 RepID=A0A938YNL2_9ARCH|nr:glycosyltransferase family 2 protein [Candidatus Diapherotrites archaeon]